MKLSTYFLLPLFFPILLFPPLKALSQVDSTSKANTHTRCVGVSISQGVIYGSSITLLSNAWYSSFPKSSFHVFNDRNEWLQMDKSGHLITAYYLSRLNHSMYVWSGVKSSKAMLYAGGVSFLYLAGIEILDGFSADWGFSWTDVAANTLGVALFVTQASLKGNTNFTLGFKNISLKYTFHQSEYWQYRPALLGSSLAEQMLKDYNGQSYWFSFNIASFLEPATKFPKWLNIALGYGADAMVGAKENPSSIDGKPFPFVRYRQYMVSLDVDLSKIKTQSKVLKTIASVFGFFKIPAPALEFNYKGVDFYPLYY